MYGVVRIGWIVVNHWLSTFGNSLQLETSLRCDADQIISLCVNIRTYNDNHPQITFARSYCWSRVILLMEVYFILFLLLEITYKSGNKTILRIRMLVITSPRPDSSKAHIHFEKINYTGYLNGSKFCAIKVWPWEKQNLVIGNGRH